MDKKIKKKDIINPFLTFNLRKEQKDKHQQQKIKSFKEKVTKAIVASVLLTTSVTLAADYAASLYGYENLGISSVIYGTLFENQYVDLPNETQVAEGAKTFLTESRYLKVRDDITLNSYARLEIKKGSSPIMVLVPSNATEQQKEHVKETVKFFNDIFEIINPDYKFQYSEKQVDEISSPYVKFGFKENLTHNGNPVGGLCYANETFGQDGQKKITYANININDTSLIETYVHEFIHALGIYDLYNLSEESETVSAMGTKRPVAEISKNDFYAISCLYTDMTNPDNVIRVNNGFNEFITKYYVDGAYTSRTESLTALITANDYSILRQYGIYKDDSTISFDAKNMGLKQIFMFQDVTNPTDILTRCYIKTDDQCNEYITNEKGETLFIRNIPIIYEDEKIVIDGHIFVTVDNVQYGVNKYECVVQVQQYEQLPELVQNSFERNGITLNQLSTKSTTKQDTGAEL